jgi:hypothetical protein
MTQQTEVIEMNDIAKFLTDDLYKTGEVNGCKPEATNSGNHSGTPSSSNSECAPIISSAIVKRLALSESGFVFDPVSGQSFSVNESGLAVLRLAQVEEEVEILVENLAQHFDASAAEIRRDVLDYADRLKEFLK